MLQHHLFFQCVTSFSSVLLQFYLARIQKCSDFSFFLLIITVPTVWINWSTPMNTATVFRSGISFVRWIFSRVQERLNYLHPSLISFGELSVFVMTFSPWHKYFFFTFSCIKSFTWLSSFHRLLQFLISPGSQVKKRQDAESWKWI